MLLYSIIQPEVMSSPKPQDDKRQIDPDKLIEMVAAEAPIWNNKLRAYSIREIVDDCWRRITIKMGFPGYKLRKKWKYLREQYCVELGKVSVGGESKWVRFNSMAFLYGIVKPRQVRPMYKYGEYEEENAISTEFVNTFQVTDPSTIEKYQLVDPLAIEGDPLVETYVCANDHLVDPLASEENQLVVPLINTIDQAVDPFESAHNLPVDTLVSTADQLVDPLVSTNDQSVDPLESSDNLPADNLASTVDRLADPLVSTNDQAVDPLESADNRSVDTLASTVDRLVDPLACGDDQLLDSLSDNSSSRWSEKSRKRTADGELKVNSCSSTSDSQTELTDKNADAEECKLKIPKGENDDKNDDMLFFRSLLPFISKIEEHRKIRFRHKILEVVEEFAYPTSP